MRTAVGNILRGRQNVDPACWRGGSCSNYSVITDRRWERPVEGSWANYNFTDFKICIEITIRSDLIGFMKDLLRCQHRSCC